VVNNLREAFPAICLVNDKRVDGGCSKRRPDIFVDVLSHVVIVEVDENAHIAYDKTCENRRIMELSEDIAHRPLVFIRFNPDGNSTGPSCWGVNGDSVAVVKRKRAVEWQDRLATLSRTVGFWITTIPDRTVELIKLFY